MRKLPFQAGRACKRCRIDFMSTRRLQVFCKRQCRNEFYQIGLSPELLDGVAPSTIGAISEMLVCADLLKRRYEVYRAISPACSSDLVIHKNGKLERVEVRTSRLGLNGEAKCAAPKAGRFDILAMVLRSGEITYQPPMPD